MIGNFAQPEERLFPILGDSRILPVVVDESHGHFGDGVSGFGGGDVAAQGIVFAMERRRILPDAECVLLS